MLQLHWARLLAFSSLFVVCDSFAQPNNTKASTAEAGQWKGKVPEKYANLKVWTDLTQELLDKNLFYGAVAVAEQLDLFFVEVNAKEAAFGTMVKSLDKGYPFSIEEYFKTSFFEPDPTSVLGRNYYFYKGKHSEKQNRLNWAQYYQDFIKEKSFEKYMYFQALRHYQKDEKKEALDLLDQILKKDPPVEMVAFYVKAARTKARIYYEMERYKESLDIYENFLLKMDPVIATDWIEAGWNLYNLKEYERTLGFLYNLETSAALEFPNLEKYILRASVYKALCARNEMNSLSARFDTDFGPALTKIRQGQDLKAIDILVKIRPKEHDEFTRYFVGLNELRRESKNLTRLPASMQELARHVYTNHQSYLKRAAYTKMLPFLDKSAEHLVILGESLKFLKYDVDRSLFNPDAVFLQEKLSNEITDPLKDLPAPQVGYEVSWQQLGDMWRDEKLAYKVRLTNQCAN